MQWFQVTCPKCTGALQVRLPEGVTSVQCSQCKAVFAVQVQPVALAPPGGPQAPVKRSRKRKKDTGNDDGSAPRMLSAYNVFMKSEVARVKAERPQLPHREAFKLAAEHWQASPMNPQNGGERFPQRAGPASSAEASAVLAAAEAGDGLFVGAEGMEAADATGAAGTAGTVDGGMPDEEGDEEDEGEEDDEEEEAQ